MHPLLPSAHTGYFENLEILVNEDEFISTDKFLNFSLGDPAFLYSKRDFLFKSGEFRGEFIQSLLTKKGSTKNLIVGHSDIPTYKRQLVLLKLLGIERVFGTNTRAINEFSYSLPLGLTNNTSESEFHPIFGNVEHFKVADSSDFCSGFTPKILANFSIQNNHSVRKKLLNELVSLSDTYDLVVENPEMNSEGRIKYLRKLREIPLVVCPEGNGADTHRLWETLYMGGVPVVLNNPLLNSLFDLLPVIRLNSWNQLKNLDYLQNAWQEARAVQWNTNVLSASYWKNEIITRSA